MIPRPGINGQVILIKDTLNIVKSYGMNPFGISAHGVVKGGAFFNPPLMALTWVKMISGSSGLYFYRL